MTSWVRLWHDMPTDPKFRTIARVSGQPLATVVAVFTFLLADASANETERGRTTATDEDIASAFDIEESDVVAIKDAMQGRVLDGDTLAGWSKRQPKKEDDSSGRAKAWREKKKAQNDSERGRTIANASERPDTDAEADTEKKEYSETNVSDAPASSGQVVNLDARTALFREGVANLSAMTGKPDQQCRSLIGRWLKTTGDDCRAVSAAIARAVDTRPADPIPWIERALRPAETEEERQYRVLL